MKRPHRTNWYKALGKAYTAAYECCYNVEACGFFNLWSTNLLVPSAHVWAGWYWVGEVRRT